MKPWLPAAFALFALLARPAHACPVVGGPPPMATSPGCDAGEVCNSMGQCVPQCDGTSCPVGCCDANGNCQPGTTPGLCGANGAACVSCSSGAVCLDAGFCNQGCLLASCTGCCTGAGCLAPASQNMGNCGLTGSLCMPCPANTVCVADPVNGGVCTPLMDAGTTDAGTITDGGGPPSDAGPSTDGGSTGSDGGPTGPGSDGGSHRAIANLGCNCVSTGGFALAASVLLLAALPFRRRLPPGNRM